MLWRALLVLALLSGVASAQPVITGWRPPTGCSTGEVILWNGSAWVCGAAGVTNSAGADVIPKSDGTDLVASRITDDGSSVGVTSSNMNLTSTTADNGRLRFAVTATANFIQSGVNATGGSANSLIFSTMNNGAEWGRFDSDGDLCLGSGGSCTSKLTVTGAASVSGNATLGDAAGDAHTVNGSLTATSGTATFGDLRGTVQTSTTTGTYTLTLSANTTHVRFNAASDAFVVGMTGGAEGRMVFIENMGAGNVFIYDEHATPGASDRWALDQTAGGFVRLANGGARGFASYNGATSRWSFSQLIGLNTPTSLAVNGPVAATGTSTFVALSTTDNVTMGNASTDAHTANGSLAITNGLTVASSGITITGSGLSVQGGAGTFDQNVVLGNAASDTITVTGHLVASGADPTISSCGTSPTVVGNDNAGTVTVGTGGSASCTITFSSTFTTAPACVVTPHFASSPYISASSATAITVAHGGPGFAAGDKLSYHCMGVP
jgi:hypothetical protein